MVLIFPIILMTALIRELKHIASLSTLANVSSFASFVLIFYQSTRDLPPITERKWIGRWEDLPLAFGMIAYSMEGISLVSSSSRHFYFDNRNSRM